MHQSILTYGEFVTYIRENVEAVLNEDREAEFKPSFYGRFSCNYVC